jgi:hypothetical protein
MNEKENLNKLEQQMNDKPLDLSNITPTISSTSDNDISSNQTVDILQELLNTIKQNNQLEVIIFPSLSLYLLKFFFRQKSKLLNEILIMKMNVLKNSALNYVSEDYPAKFMFTIIPIHQLNPWFLHLFK